MRRSRRRRLPAGRPVVALVTDAIAPYHRGGKEQRYMEIAPRLAKYMDVHVYTMRWWGRPRRIARDGVTYHGITPLIPLYRDGRRSTLQAVCFALACLRLIVARFDVLEADHMPYLQLFPLWLVARLRRRRFVITWHEVWDAAGWAAYIGRAGRMAWWLERRAMRLPDAILAASPETAERLRVVAGPDADVVVAPNGIDLDAVADIQPSAAADIVSVGRLIAHKRFDLVLHAVALLAAEGLSPTVQIVGHGPETDALHRLAVRLGITHLVEFQHEIISHHELLARTKGAKAFVTASEREGFGIAALEALACGVPVITTDAPNNLARHLVARSVRGVVCPPTAEAIASALRPLLQSRLAHTNGRAGTEPEPWLSDYDWSTTVDTVAGVLTDGERPGGVPEPRARLRRCSRSPRPWPTSRPMSRAKVSRPASARERRSPVAR